MTDMTDAQHLTDPDALPFDDLAQAAAESEARDVLLAAAIASHQAWDFDAAEEAYRELLALEPAHADANHNLGVLLAIQRNQPASALPYFEAALNADSHSGQHWFSYIDALIRAGQHAAAAQFLPLAQAHGLQPSMANVLADRLAADEAPAPLAAAMVSAAPAAVTAADKEGLVALFRAGHFEEGEARTRSLIAAHPDDGFLWKALGTMLQPQGRKEEALAAKVRAAELLPQDVEALCNLGRAYFELSRPAEAEAALRSAIALAPGHAEAHNNLGLALNAQGQVSEADLSFQRAVQIKPDFAEAHNNLSGIYTAQGLIDEAVRALRQAVAAKPDYRVAFDNMLFVLNYHPTLSAEEIFETYAAYDRQFGVPQRAHWQPHTNDRRAGRRLRVGYVSPDFRHHACTFFMEPLLAGHDRRAVEVFAYAELREAEDAATERYRGYADHWVPTRGLSDAALADRIRADGIDILVDLAGHTKGNRLGAFALKPAPVSLSWMGFGCTTGLSAIDYYLTDDASAPTGSEHLFSETPWRLPESPYAVYRPGAGMGEVSALPALSRGHVTVGSLTRGVRINERTVRVWTEILRRIPGARLVIDSRSFEDPAVQDALAARFVAQGAAPEQLQIGCHNPWDALRGIDIGLDCFPHNSGTTLFESLYMGLPFVSLADRPSVGRIGSAILQGLGRPEWIARSEAEYVDKVVALASDLPALAQLRQGLRAEMQASPLMDEAGFVQRVEDAYRQMFARWAGAQPQAASSVAPAEMSLAALQAELAYNQANQCHERGDLAQAEAHYRQALALRPRYAEALSNLGLVLQAQGRNTEAEAAYREALAIRPDYALAHHNLGNVLQHSGDLVGAVARYHQAMALGLVSEHLFDNLLFLLNYHPDLGAEEIFTSYQAYERRFGLPHRAAWAPHTNTRTTKRVLKVGYVSPDFRNHAVCRFLEPLLAAHDKAVVQVFAYAELAREDEATLRFKSYVDQWVPTRGLSDDALAARIRADGIDILVDLAGHTKGNRLGVFARKPAPVSLSWMGYGYTTGLAAIDYYLTDAVSAPAGSEHLFSEKLWRLPELPYAVYRPSADMGDVGTPPVLQRGFVTLGSLSRSIRINAHTLRVWSDILQRLPDARLVIDSRNFADVAACQGLRAKFEALGVAADRLHIGCHSPPWDVLRGIDIGLDCFPHNSGTTLFETLYMGVPFVTLAGRPSVGRIGSAILHGLGRPEWIARTEAEYVDKVVQLAQNTQQLALLRMMLRSQMQVSPLMDEAGFARGVEAAYREMFSRWASQPLAEPVGKIKLPRPSKAAKPGPGKGAAMARPVAGRAPAGPSQEEAEALVQLFRERRFADGERLATQLTTRFPDSGFAWKALGVMLQPQGRPAEVLAAKIRAAALLPRDAEAHCNLGHVLQDQGRLADAERALQRALALKPDYLEAHNNLGITYQKQGRLDESLASFRRALALDPAQEDIYSNLLFTANYHPDQSAEDIYAAYREYDLRFGQPLRGGWTPHGNPRQTGPVLGRVLKVGYVSPDFRNHACCRFLEPLLAAHHKGVVQTTAYAELAREDEATARYRTYVDHWVPTRGLSDAALAERIRADGIDILVDVAGHTVGNRLGVFARKPAPVSLSWLGFGYTTGLSAIDYYLTDEASAPAGCETLFAEAPWRLPAGWAYRPAQGMGEPGPLPALRQGHITLGTLTRSVRINHHTVRVWSEILRRLPEAHLVVDSSSFVDAAAQQALAARFAAHGIGADRLHIGYHSPPWDVLRGIDIGLDCFPHNSGTTLFESLYMGVPYVSLAGRPSVGRLGSSILQGAGHPEWIAETEAEYIDKVVALAQDWPALAAVRQQLRGQMQASVLMDEDGFAHQVEAAYLRMFATWSAGNNDALEALVQQAQAAYNLGNSQHDQGLLDAAEINFRKALALVPEFAEAHANLALVLQQQGRVADAEPHYRQALLLNPESATAHYNLGTNLKAQGQLKEAESCFRAALARRPDFTPALLNLDRVLQELGRWVESEVYWRDMLRVKPDFIAAYVNLSAVLRRQQRASEALACLRKALEVEPDNLSLNMQVGSVLKDLNRFDEAESSCRRAIELDPQSAIAWNGLAELFNATQRLVEAEQGFRRALELDPKLAPAHGNLGIVLQNQGRLHEAEASMRQSLALAPGDASAHGNLLFVLNYHPDKTGDEVFAEYRAYDENFCVQHRKEWKPHGNQRQADRVLKVGYVSPDFRSHSCCNFLEPLLSGHDKSRVRVYAYAELLREDAATARYKAYVDHWVPTRGMADAALAERIRADGIDILVDLAGHTGGSRLGVFARKPAPVSLTWMGYGYTTGLSAIDYFLTDAASAPPGSERFFSEKPWRLPTGWVYRPAGAARMGEVNALPAAQNGYVTFGTLTRALRVNHRTVRVWAELLKRVPNARLVIDSRSYQDAQTQEELAARFMAQGVAREQLLIGCHSPPWDVLRGIDIGLDCFPHNSGTTLFETLYMGIPFVTLADRPSVGCLGSSILHGIGHAEWIAATEEDYIAKAAALARDTTRLAALRANLRAEMQASALMDEAAFTRQVEDAYSQMFSQWCGAKP